MISQHWFRSRNNLVPNKRQAITMMTSPNGNIFRGTGPLCGEFTGSPHKGQWRGALMFSLISARINNWVNNREAGDLRRHRGHYDVSVMTRLNWWPGVVTHMCVTWPTIWISTRRPLGDFNGIFGTHSQAHFSDRRVGFILWNRFQMNVTGPYWW